MKKRTKWNKRSVGDRGEDPREGRDEKLGCVGWLFSVKEVILFKL